MSFGKWNMPVKKNQVQEDSGGEKALLWIISFADMISLLMAFFVMLQTMACERSNELLNPGMGKFEMTIGEFNRNINGFGMPGLFGRHGENLDFGSKRGHYLTDIKDTGQIDQSAIDGEHEKLSRLFSELTSFADTHRSQLAGSNPNYSITPITFADGKSQLNEDAKTYLTNYAVAFCQSQQRDNLIIYIVGCAPDIASLPDQWRISEARAAATAAFLNKSMPENLGEKIFWWGAGSGKKWVMSTKDAVNQPNILIATINTTDHQNIEP